ncbi:glycosyltransferase family 4 protein [Singulisphaera acidiphila]|uniref:Glycosyltransferase n=1 Tax=Singulisphaera acidiphila (strain ATCC BAA-1392 / DSM 18658 / VKM B-2454 / MOB10) TaxID=886293 RepID=L0DH06_SINAD|nr:glycosyltransferase family 4 protein [Singulisphaera acidiphila]AGA28135.1 glycosyltransferase [Singulisphaera acidiphila DSM 18658]
MKSTPNRTSSEQLKIAHVYNIDISILVHLRAQLRSLVAAGADVCGICAPGDILKEDTTFEDGIRVRLIPMGRDFEPFNDARVLARLVGLFRAERFDIVHTHGPKQALLGRVAARMAGVPVVVNTVHGFYFHENSTFKDRFLHKTAERIGSQCGDMMLCQSREDVETARRLRLAAPSRIKYLGNGINLSAFDPDRVDAEKVHALRTRLGIPADAVLIGTIARKARDKGYVEFCEAAARVRQVFPNVRFLCAGGVFEEKPSQRIPADLPDKLGIRDILIDLEYQHDVPALLAALDLFVFPSYREGFPRAVMEAAAMGLPIVATEIRGCREALTEGESGLLVPPRDAEALTQAILRVLKDPPFRDRLGRAARQRAVLEFDENLYIQRILQAYRELLGKKLPAKESLLRMDRPQETVSLAGELS